MRKAWEYVYCVPLCVIVWRPDTRDHLRELERLRSLSNENNCSSYNPTVNETRTQHSFEDVP